MSPADLPRVLAVLPTFLAVFDSCRRLLWANRYGYGYGPGLLGSDTADIVHEDDRPAWSRAIYRACNARETLRFCVRLRSLEPPRLVRLAGTMAPASPAGGQCAAVSHDVTDQPSGVCPCCGALHDGAAEPPRPAAAAMKLLSPLSAQALAALEGRGWVSTAELLRAVGGSSDLRAVLRGLAARGGVDLSQGRGVRITPAGLETLRREPSD